MDTPARSTNQKNAPRDDSRGERLAAALRANLKRRKAQARSQAEARAGEQKPAKTVNTSGS